jgi:hypothetical protein
MEYPRWLWPSVHLDLRRSDTNPDDRNGNHGGQQTSKPVRRSARRHHAVEPPLVKWRIARTDRMRLPGYIAFGSVLHAGL